ncbi:MAG: dolichyl-phosphate beta-D-mannosyltransferase [Deltaproteobacteria bacterium HGW-Deltaproteobacteria-20]|jgi:dolichol-phosphate mannosyltransferase|nr:MAG: dolichyl-phosphate beta-D-mannosyltransferase [Deltaproteobacteria bacterium HGW-Deltaproteobacteria-20]
MSDLRVLVIVPTYNERDNLPILIDAVFAVLDKAHVLVVDDASPDGTGDIVDEMVARDSRVHVLHRQAKLGLGTAYIEGFKLALERGYDIVVEMDADMSHDPRYLPALIGAIQEGADVAVGSRNIPQGGVEGWGLGRQLLSKGGSLYSRVILGVDIRDLTTGYKAFSRRALEIIGVDEIRSNGYSFQIETTYRALCWGLHVVEVPIVFVDRRVGRSKMSHRVFVEAVGMVWKLRAEALLNRL